MHPLLQRSTAEKPHRLLVTSWGTTKVGRTHFALTFPDPIAVFDFDAGVKDIEWKFPDKEVYRAPLYVPNGVDECARLLSQFEEALVQTCHDFQNRGGGTVVLDTASILWQLVQRVDLRAVREKKARPGQDPDAVKVMQFQYADANLRMSRLLRHVIPFEDVNAVFIHGAADIYNDAGQPTGEIGCHGWKAVHGVSQFTLRHYVRDGTFWARFDTCRFDPTLEGIELPDPTYQTFREMFLE